MQIFVWCGKTVWNVPQETLEKMLDPNSVKIATYY